MKRIILFLTLFPFVLTCAGKNPRVVIRTELGDITVELYPDKRSEEHTSELQSH